MLSEEEHFGLALAVAGRHDEALVYLQKAERVRSSAELQNGLGAIYSARNQVSLGDSGLAIGHAVSFSGNECRLLPLDLTLLLSEIHHRHISFTPP